jgi:hypothetical protein
MGQLPDLKLHDLQAGGLSASSARPITIATFCTRATPTLLILLLLGGCATYQFGSRSLFRDDIRTVHVPIARNETFRHDLGPRLTEAVIRQIEQRTPYKVTDDPNADSTLVIHVTDQTKSVLTRAATNEPRALDAMIATVISWTDRSGSPILQNQLTLETSLATELLQGTRFVPEAGQSIQTAMQATIDDLADRIVSQMEYRW